MYVEKGKVYRKLGTNKRVRVAFLFRGDTEEHENQQMVKIAHLEVPGGWTNITKEEFGNQYILDDGNGDEAVPEDGKEGMNRGKRKKQRKAKWNQGQGKFDLVRE